MRRLKYCYWSIACGENRNAVQRCVDSARQNGVFKEFHIFTDKRLEHCESYEAFRITEGEELLQLVYLKAGISKLLFDYFIWVDPETVFRSNPMAILGTLGRSPIHVPLEVALARVPDTKRIMGCTPSEYSDLMRTLGVQNEIYSNHAAFWIIDHSAIDMVCGLAASGLQNAKNLGRSGDIALGLGYAMQMLCGNPELHLMDRRLDIWVPDYAGALPAARFDAKPWCYNDLLTGDRHHVNPSIVHCPRISARKAETSGSLNDVQLRNNPWREKLSESW